MNLESKKSLFKIFSNYKQRLIIQKSKLTIRFVFGKILKLRKLVNIKNNIEFLIKNSSSRNRDRICFNSGLRLLTMTQYMLKEENCIYFVWEYI